MATPPAPATTLSSGPVCWVDADWDRERASDGVSRYGAYLRGHAGAFVPVWDETADGRGGTITADAGEFAAAAFQVATGPIMSPGYVRWHARVLAWQVGYGTDPDPARLILQVTLATALPVWRSSPWRSWTEHLGRDWREPDEGQPAALASLVLRWPLPVATLPCPQRPARPGLPNLQDAMASVAALVVAVNATAGPVLARLEQGRHRQGGAAP
jgi:hypothetical protein